LVSPTTLSLREKYILRLLRRIFGPEREEMVGGSRRLHNE
jgi:hypothetical protein